MLLSRHWPGARPVSAPQAPLTWAGLSELLRLAAVAWKVAGCLQAQMAALGFLFQNYMGPLRLVLSPADMAAVFINLEVRTRPRSLRAGPAPNLLQCDCPHLGMGGPG